MTFLEIARLMAATDGMPDTIVPLLLRRIRSLDAKGLVAVQREDSGRREGHLNLTGACHARIASELIDFGLDAETLRALSKALDHFDPENQRSELESAIELIRAGHPVALVVTLNQVNPRAFRVEWQKWHSFRLEGLREEGTSRAARAQAMVMRPITRAVLRVDLSELLTGFIEAHDQAVGA